MLQIEMAGPDDVTEIENILTLSFCADPTFRWLLPKANDYIASRKVFSVLGGDSLAHHAAYKTAGGEGVALWVPPGIQPDEDAISEFMVTHIREESLSEVITLHETLNDRKPKEAFWYLQFLGVDPVCQGQGIGSMLMKHTLRELDKEHALSYLVSTSPKNIELYQRHGYELLDVVRCGDAPPMFPMIRLPR